ncbi:hypothetical protein HRbin15_00794 [bacterium HR15]|nr:hypothetical protein HRbin15_00794 [bacterium HR15]
MQTFRDRPALAWGFLVIALLVLLASYYFFVLRPNQPSAPPAPVPATGGQPAAPSPSSGGGQTVPY